MQGSLPQLQKGMSLRDKCKTALEMFLGTARKALLDVSLLKVVLRI